MAHILTIKLPSPLLYRLNEAAHQKGLSKGAVIREALEKALETEFNALHQFKEITKKILNKKRPRSNLDWDEIYKQTRNASPLSPEQEVLIGRRRGL